MAESLTVESCGTCWLNIMRAGPTTISSPSDSVLRDVIRSPPTNVPFLLPMSSIVVAVGLTEMLACWRETLLESMEISASSPLPMMLSPT